MEKINYKDIEVGAEFKIDNMTYTVKTKNSRRLYCRQSLDMGLANPVISEGTMHKTTYEAAVAAGRVKFIKNGVIPEWKKTFQPVENQMTNDETGAKLYQVIFDNGIETKIWSKSNDLENIADFYKTHVDYERASIKEIRCVPKEHIEIEGLNRKFEKEKMSQKEIDDLGTKLFLEECEVFCIFQHEGKYVVNSISENFCVYCPGVYDTYEEAVQGFTKNRILESYLLNEDNFLGIYDEVERYQYDAFLKATTLRYGEQRTMEYMLVKGKELNQLIEQGMSCLPKVDDDLYFYYAADDETIGEMPISADELLQDISDHNHDYSEDITKEEFDLAWAIHSKEKILSEDEEDRIETIFSEEVLKLRRECEVPCAAQDLLLKEVPKAEEKYRNIINQNTDIDLDKKGVFSALDLQELIASLSRKEDRAQVKYQYRVTKPSSVATQLRTDIPMSEKTFHLRSKTIDEEKKGKDSFIFNKLSGVPDITEEKANSSIELYNEIMDAYLDTKVLDTVQFTPDERVIIGVCDNIEDAYVEWFKTFCSDLTELKFEDVNAKIQEYLRKGNYISSREAKEIYDRVEKLYKNIDHLMEKEMFKEAALTLYSSDDGMMEYYGIVAFIRSYLPETQRIDSNANSDLKNRELLVEKLMEIEHQQKLKRQVSTQMKANHDLLGKYINNEKIIKPANSKKQSKDKNIDQPTR